MLRTLDSILSHTGKNPKVQAVRTGGDSSSLDGAGLRLLRASGTWCGDLHTCSPCSEQP